MHFILVYDTQWEYKWHKHFRYNINSLSNAMAPGGIGANVLASSPPTPSEALFPNCPLPVRM